MCVWCAIACHNIISIVHHVPYFLPYCSKECVVDFRTPKPRKKNYNFLLTLKRLVLQFPVLCVCVCVPASVCISIF